MPLQPSASPPIGGSSIFKSVQSNTAAQPSAVIPIANTSPLRIAADQRENVALARQLANHQRYVCYQLPRYHRCGHRMGQGAGEIKDLLLSRQHIDRLGYGTECDAECAVDHSRRTITPERCSLCASVEECFSVVLKHSCGHIAGVMCSAGSDHHSRLGSSEVCDARCHSVQVDQDVGGSCELCNGRHCCMIFGGYACGHRGSVFGHHVVGSNHLMNLGSSLAPCDPRCRFEYQTREIGKRCLRCKPMYMMSGQHGIYGR